MPVCGFVSKMYLPVCGLVAPVYLPIFGFVSKMYLPVYGVVSQWYTPLVVSPAPTPLFTTGLFSNCSNPCLYPVSACKDNNIIPISIFCMFLPSSKNIPTIFHFAHFSAKNTIIAVILSCHNAVISINISNPNAHPFFIAPD